MTSLLAELSAIAGAAFAAEGLSPELGQVQVSDRPDLAQFQCNGALARRSCEGQSARHRRKDRGAACANRRCSPRWRSPGPASSIWISRDVALSTRLQALARAARQCAPSERRRQTRDDRFRRAEHRQAHACGSSALVHHRRLPAAPVSRQWLVGDQRRASGRLGPADGPADLRDRIERTARPAVLRPKFVGPYPEESPVTHGRSGNALSARLGRLQGRSGAAGSGAPRHGGSAGRASRLSRAVAAFRERVGSRPEARIRQPGCDVRSVERRIQRRCADPAHDRRPEGTTASPNSAKARWWCRWRASDDKKPCRR